MSTLFDRHPLPWKILHGKTADPEKYDGGFDVYASDGGVVIAGGTYTGDGDTEVNLNRRQAAELVEIVNAFHRL